ncbi:hypothetical protein Tco_0898577 [Tanacetum coccineum]
MGMDWLSKRKFVIVCHENVVRIPIKEDVILRVHGERTLGAAKALIKAKIDEPKLNDISVVRDFIDVFPEDFSMTTATIMGDALSRKKRVKLRRVSRKILAAQSEAFKQENVLAERLHGLDQQMERKGDESLYFMDRIWVLLVGSIMDEAHASRYLIGESSLTGLELLQEMTDKVVLVKEKPKPMRDHQKSYVDYKRKPLEFEVGDQGIIKGVALEGRTYRLRLPEDLSSVLDTFHVSNLKKCMTDANLHVPLNEIKVDKTLCFVEEPVEIMD